MRMAAWAHGLAVAIGLGRAEDIEFLAARFEPFRGQHVANGAGPGVYMGRSSCRSARRPPRWAISTRQLFPAFQSLGMTDVASNMEFTRVDADELGHREQRAQMARRTPHPAEDTPGRRRSAGPGTLVHNA